MRQCPYCHNEVGNNDNFCPNCGYTLPYETRLNRDNTLRNVAKYFMLASAILSIVPLIPLAWTIPMTVIYFNKVEKNEDVTLAFKICTLLFVSVVAGILMLVDDNK